MRPAYSKRGAPSSINWKTLSGQCHIFRNKCDVMKSSFLYLHILMCVLGSRGWVQAWFTWTRPAVSNQPAITGQACSTWLSLLYLDQSCDAATLLMTLQCCICFSGHHASMKVHTLQYMCVAKLSNLSKNRTRICGT
jgi:hypothetical protein